MQATETATQFVYLVDDDESLRQAVSRLLQAAGFPVRAYASAAEFMLDREDSPRGCLLLDVRMPGGPGGLELHRSLVRQGFSLPVIFLTGHGDIPMSVMAIKNGAFDFLIKPIKKDILVASVSTALAEEAAAWESAGRLRELARRQKTLTPSELETYQRVIAGLPNKQIADELGCSERTVKAHRASVMSKMGAVSLAELVHGADELKRV